MYHIRAYANRERGKKKGGGGGGEAPKGADFVCGRSYDLWVGVIMSWRRRRKEKQNRRIAKTERDRHTEEIGKYKIKTNKEYPMYRVVPTRFVFGISVGDSCKTWEGLDGCGAPRAGCPLSGVRGPIRRSVRSFCRGGPAPVGGRKLRGTNQMLI